MWIFAPLAALLFLPALIEAKPLIGRAGLPGAAGPAAILVLVGWAAAAAAPAYSADRQQRFVIQHVTDTKTRKAWWSVLDDCAPLPSGFGNGWQRGKLPVGDTVRWFKPTAIDSAMSAPAIQVVSQVHNGSERTLTLRISSNGADDVSLVAPEDAKILSAGMARFVRPIDQNEDGKYYIGCSGRSCDGAILQLTTNDPKPIDFLVIGSRRSLPPSARSLIAARPKFARPQYSTDASIVFTHVSL